MRRGTSTAPSRTKSKSLHRLCTTHSFLWEPQTGRATGSRKHQPVHSLSLDGKPTPRPRVDLRQRARGGHAGGPGLGLRPPPPRAAILQTRTQATTFVHSASSSGGLGASSISCRHSSASCEQWAPGHTSGPSRTQYTDRTIGARRGAHRPDGPRIKCRLLADRRRLIIDCRRLRVSRRGLKGMPLHCGGTHTILSGEQEAYPSRCKKLCWGVRPQTRQGNGIDANI